MKQWPKNKHLDNNSEKLDNLEDFTNNKNTIPFDDVEFLKRENQNLEFLLYKYNIILSEYQLKYGNEIFAHLDDLLNKEKQTYLNEENKSSLQFRKQMIENISIIKELEKNNLEVTEKNEFLNSELIRYQKEIEDLVKENTELRNDLEELKEDHNKLYKSILDSNIKDPAQINFPAANEKNQTQNNSANLFYNNTKHSNITTIPNLHSNNIHNQNMPSSPSQQNFYKTDQFKLNKNLFYTSSQNINNNNNKNFENNNNNNNINTNNNTGTNFYNSANNFNNTNNNNNTIGFLKAQNEELFNLIENMKSEEIQLKAAYTDLRDKYLKTSAESEDLQDSLAKYKNECEELSKMKNFVEEKMKENNNQIIIAESKLSALKSECEAFAIKNANLKERLQYYQEQYEDLETRKNQEIESSLRETHEARDREVIAKSKNTIFEDENQILKFDLNRFKNENSLLRFDLDHLSKLIEESNCTVKNAIEKEKGLDALARVHKKKVEDALLEKEKSLTRQKLLEKQIVKLSEENTKLLMEKQFNFDAQIENAKAKFSQICILKDDELANLKADLFGARIEKDKYLTEFTILKKEAENFSKVFSDEMQKYVKKYEDSEKSALQREKELTAQIGELTKKLEQSEFFRINSQKENEIFKNSESERKNAVESAGRNDEFKTRELRKFKEKCDIAVKENEALGKEIQKLNFNFTHKLEQLKEKHRLELRILEDSSSYQKSQFDSGQAKAFEMVKKQENITEKYKEEYKSTVAYYENMVDILVRENLSLKKRCANFDKDESDKGLVY